MKKTILISAAVLALAGCQSGDPQLGKSSVDKVLKAMTLEEKASQLRFDAPAIERLGIPAYNWWNEAACIDGCGVWRIFFKVIAPLMKPAVATVGIYTFLQCWNDLMFANIFISKTELKTLPVGVQALSGQYTTAWGPIGAALVLAAFPTLFIYIFLSKRIQESFVAGAVKG